MYRHLASRVNHKPTVLSYEAVAMKQLFGAIDTAKIAPMTCTKAKHLSRPYTGHYTNNISN